MTQKIPSKPKIKKLKLASIYPTWPFDATVSSIESTAVTNKDKNNESAFIIYLDIRNISKKSIKVEFPFTSYVTSKRYEFNQDYWLTRFENGANGISIQSGAYKRAGLIYLQDKLSKVSVGDELTINATVSPPPNVKYIVTLRCESIDPYIFNPIPVEQEELLQAETKSVVKPAAAADGNDGKKEITSIIERLELLEDKMCVSLGGIYATIEKSWKDNHFELCINFDILSSSGDPLENSFSIQGVAYNEIGQSLGIGNQYIDCDKFFGLASKSITITVDQVPAKIRLYPVR